MKLSDKFSGFRNRRLEIHLPWLALACLMWVGNPQPVLADSPVLSKAPIKASVKTPVKAPVKVPAKVQTPAKAPPVVKVEVPKVEVASIEQTGFGFSQAAQNLKSTVDSIMMILGNEYFQIHTTVRRQVLWEILGQRIDFERMARRSLAGEWETRSPQEKKQFIRLFKKLLEQSYARWIEGFTAGRVHYLGERVKGKYAKVKTRIFEAGQSVDVEYKLVRQKGVWQVYDFMVQGVSVVRNYRAQFSKVLVRESYQGLLKRLKAQVG